MPPPRRLIWLSPDRFDAKIDKSTWLEMGRCLEGLGWNVTILTGYRSADVAAAKPFGALVEFLPALDWPFLFRLSLLRNMGCWLARNACPDDVVMMNEDALWLLPWLRRIGIRHVHLDFRTLPVDLHRWKRRVDWLLSWKIPVALFGKRVNSYSFITERLRAEVEREFGLNARHFAIWQSAVDAERFAHAISNAKCEGTVRLFYHGSVSIKRGLATVIEAFARIGGRRSVEFVIVGDGEDRAALEDLAYAHGLSGRVTFKGFMPYDRIADELREAHICICPLPDRREWNVSSPLKLFEYMAAGKPVILTPIPAHRDVVGDAAFVVWTRGHEADDFRVAIEAALDAREGLAGAARAGPELVRQHFTWVAQAKKLNTYLASRLRPEQANGNVEIGQGRVELGR